MPKPTAYQGKRLKPLLASTAQTATEALENANGDHIHAQSQIIGLTAAIAAKADDANVVHNAGDEDIDGQKNFLADITFETASLGPVLIDRTTARAYRLFVDSGVLSIEMV